MVYFCGKVFSILNLKGRMLRPDLEPEIAVKAAIAGCGRRRMTLSPALLTSRVFSYSEATGCRGRTKERREHFHEQSGTLSQVMNQGVLGALSLEP